MYFTDRVLGSGQPDHDDPGRPGLVKAIVASLKHSSQLTLAGSNNNICIIMKEECSNIYVMAEGDFVVVF